MNSIHLIVTGKVQGVFFRDSTKRKALELKLKGYAKNLSNGTVEVIAQGEAEKIKELIVFIKNHPGYSKVKEVHAKEKEFENFEGFEVY